MTIESYRDLRVWQRAVDLAEQVYRVTGEFPREEQFGLTIQVRRAVVSVSSNIAEGHGRKHRADFLRFLSISRGSLMEVETQLEIARRLAYVSSAQYQELNANCQDVGRLLNGLIRALENRHPGPISSET